MSAPQTGDGVLAGGQAPLPAAILGLLELTMVMQLFVRKGRKISGETQFCAKHSSLSPNALKLKPIARYKMSTMSNFVDISFDCLPLRSVPRFDVPLDDAAARGRGVRQAGPPGGRQSTGSSTPITCTTPSASST